MCHVVALASRVFEALLRIHPYVNGNGHIARLIVWCILGRYGYWPLRWTIDPRPTFPEYTVAIKEYRSGNPDMLERMIMQCLTQ